MIANYLKTTFRNITKQKYYSLLNIIGLTIGLTCSFLIFLYVKTELSYDKFYKDSERIYRLCNINNMGNKIDTYCNAPRPMSWKMKEIYPEIEEVTRMCGVNGLYTHAAELYYEDDIINNNNIFAADSTYFNVFSHKFIAGNPETALNRPASLVLTESLAKRIFKNENPLDKIVRIDNAIPMTVTAVIEDIPGSSHLPFEALTSWDLAYRPGEENVWYGWHVYHYLKFAPNADMTAFHAKMPDFYTTYLKETFDRLNGTSTPFVQSLNSIRLHSHYVWEPYPTGNILYVYVFSCIAVFLLLIASVNYINLTTARSFRRSKEVGLRKVFGSQRNSIFLQFIIESETLAIIAFILSLLTIEIVVPFFNYITGYDFKDYIHETSSLFLLFGTSILIGFLSGFYPAVYLSGFQPVKVLKGMMMKGARGVYLRRILIVFQFTVSIALIASTLVVINQLNYTRSKDLGFDKENVAVVLVRDSVMFRQLPAFREELLKEADIESVSYSFNLPGTTFNRFPADLENNNGEFEQISNQFMVIDPYYIDTMKMKIIQGRGFDPAIDKFPIQSLIVNKAAVTKYGWANPIGKKVRFSNTDNDGNVPAGQQPYIYAEIVGVVDDFHASSLHEEINPILIFPITENGSYYFGLLRCFIRFSSENPQTSINNIERVFRKFDQNSNFNYIVLDDSLDRLYLNEHRLFSLLIYFAVIAIFIACLGLLGLAAYTAEQRTREIGVRKIMGATPQNIVFTLSGEFTRWVILSNAIALPIAWIFMNKWLRNFAYHINPQWWHFLLAATVSFFIAFLTVSFQTLKAANTNPAKALKYE